MLLGDKNMNRTGARRLAGMAMALAVSLPVHAETLQEAVSAAVATNPQVLSTIRRQEAADAGIGVARGGYFPRVDLAYGRGNAETRNPSTIAANQNWADLNRRQGSAVLNQMLWDGLATASEVQHRRTVSASSAHRVYGTAENIALQAVEAFLDVLRNRQQVASAW